MTARATRSPVDVPALLAGATGLTGRFLARLEQLVSIDSGSGDVDGLRRVADVVARDLERLGMSLQLHEVRDQEGRDLGPVVVGRRTGDHPKGSRLLLVGHLDTVFDAGTAAARPFSVCGDRVMGPGVSDDKGGVVASLVALELLGGQAPYAELVVAFVPDEEIGSPGSAPVLTELARQADVALCLECAREDGSIVSARKGAADVVLRVSGRAAHAGVERERGVDAAVAAAHLVLALDALNGQWPDVGVNVGLLRGGTRPNVVAAEAELVADVRAATVSSYDAALEAVAELAARPAVEGAQVTLEVRNPTPPMERSAATARVAELYTDLASELGLTVADVGTGGVADANLLAALGLPVLDGLGPVGGDDHSVTEWLDLASVPSRVGLLAALVAALGPAAPPTGGPR